jgi:hypothetical protein
MDETTALKTTAIARPTSAQKNRQKKHRGRQSTAGMPVGKLSNSKYASNSNFANK